MKDKKNSDLVLFPEGFIEPHVLSGSQPNTNILVGFSGGADSRALLDMLVGYAKKNGASVFAAHINHLIRGEEAERDEEFCRATAKEYGIPIFVHRVDIPSLAKETGKSIELCARDERYAFFAKVMRENSIPLLATAHNANDNLETMLFNLSRGSGLSGLCGIPPKRECEGGLLIRPILLLSKAEILSYCEKNGLSFVTDSTNVDTEYTRNKIRAEIIPVLGEISSAPERKAAEASALLRRDNEFLSSMADDLIANKSSDGKIAISDILSVHEAVSSRAIMKLFDRVCDTSLEQVHVNDVLSLCKSAKENSRISLPSGFCTAIKEGHLCFISQDEVITPSPVAFEIEAHRGENFISQINAEIVIGKSQSEINIYKKSIQFTINSAKINGTFTLRERRAGDKIVMGGMHKSVKKLMCDKKIPAEIRGRIPMICYEDEIIAIPFLGASDKVNPKKCAKDEENNILSIQFYLY